MTYDKHQSVRFSDVAVVVDGVAALYDGTLVRVDQPKGWDDYRHLAPMGSCLPITSRKAKKAAVDAIKALTAPTTH